MVIIPGLLGWGNLEGDKHFLPVIVALHLGTSIALVLYFWRDWLQVLRTLLTSIKQGEVHVGSESWVSWLIILGCIPGGLLGVVFEKPLKTLFASPLVAATFLMINGGVLFLGEALCRRGEKKENGVLQDKQEARSAFAQAESHVGLPPEKRAALELPPRTWEQTRLSRAVHASFSSCDVSQRQNMPFRSLRSLSWKDALLVGVGQALALLPGISRSGATMVAGLGIGLNHEDAARYSFLLGTPLIGAAALLEVPQLLGQPVSVLLLVMVGMGIAGIAAFLSTKFLLKYFQTGRLYPFACYCCGAGLLALLLFFFVQLGN